MLANCLRGGREEVKREIGGGDGYVKKDMRVGTLKEGDGGDVPF